MALIDGAKINLRSSAKIHEFAHAHIGFSIPTTPGIAAPNGLGISGHSE
jgi:hypothetical protein